MYTIKEGEKSGQEIKFFSTVPVLCISQPCSFETRIKSPDYLTLYHRKVNGSTETPSCMFRFETGRWNFGLKRGLFINEPLLLKAVKGPLMYPKTTGKLEFLPLNQTGTILNGYRLPDIKVLFQNVKCFIKMVRWFD